MPVPVRGPHVVVGVGRGGAQDTWGLVGGLPLVCHLSPSIGWNVCPRAQRNEAQLAAAEKFVVLPASRLWCPLMHSDAFFRDEIHDITAYVGFSWMCQLITRLNE